MYQSAPKKSSSWTPTSIQKKSKNFSKPGSSAVQPKREALSDSQDASYSTIKTDLLTANIMRSLETQESEQADTQTVQRQSQTGGAALTLVAPPIVSTPTVQSKAIGIQRLCNECASEQQEKSGEEGKDVLEMSFASSGIQTKLTVGTPGDVYEQEADRMAQQVMSMPTAAAAAPRQVQRFGEEPSPVGMYSSLAQSITPVVHRQVDEQLQMRPLVQRAFQAGGNEASGDLESRLNASKGSGSALAPEVRAFMEPRFGADFSAVRVHTGTEAVQMNRELGAQAFAHGSDVYFGAGKSPGNNELTAHELTHVVQQTGAVQRQMSPACRQTNRYPGNLEHEMIEQDYQQNVNSNSATEFSIPGSGPNGGTGYADIVALNAHAIYEIKTYLGSPQGVNEAQRYRRFAQQNCDPNAPWHVGMQYPYRVIPLDAQRELVAQQYPQFPGVITYYTRQRQRQPQPVPVPERKREPVTDRQTALQQIAKFVKQVIQSGENAEQAAQRFLAEHPEIKYYLIGAAVIIAVGTILEDIITLGGGILDDPASFAVVWALVKVAQTAP